jgi:ABC-type sugar transport system permease subunit
MKNPFSNKWNVLVFALPALLLFTLFVTYPLLNSLALGFTDSDGVSKPAFVGLANYSRLWRDRHFMDANLKSLGLALLAVLFNACAGVMAAILLSNLGERAQRFFRNAFLIPLVLSTTVISQLWLTVYDADWGLLNRFLAALGLGSLQNRWLIDNRTAMVCVAVVGMWQCFGYLTLLAYAGLNAIPKEYKEAAVIDGAGFFRTTFSITLPLMSEVIKICLTVSTVGGLFTFPQVYVMTGGGPGRMTQTVMMFIYTSVFSSQRFGYGCAVSSVVILETVILLLIINRFVAREKIEF